MGGELKPMTQNEQTVRSAGEAAEREVAGKRSCTDNERAYPHGSEVSDDERYMICIDGKWINKDDLESVGC
jgi:hypothetical protein